MPGDVDPSLLLLRERTGVTSIAGKIFVYGINVEKAMALWIQFGELLAATLSKNRMARIAIAGLVSSVFRLEPYDSHRDSGSSPPNLYD